MSDQNEQLKTWPAEIWLQHGCDELCDYAEVRGDELTWCVDNINESDVRYVRADLAPAAAPIVQPVGDERAAFEEWARSVGYDVSSFRAEDEIAYSATFANVAFDGWQARAALAAADAKDAARYRWLRDNCNVGFDQSQDVQMVITKRLKVTPPKRWSASPNAKFRIEIRAALDALVDAAIATSADEVKS